MFLKEKTAKDSICKEQEIVQIESGSYENKALVKSTTFGLKFGVSRKLRPETPSSDLKLRPRQIWKTQTPSKNLTRKLRQTPLSGVYPHRSQF